MNSPPCLNCGSHTYEAKIEYGRPGSFVPGLFNIQVFKCTDCEENNVNSKVEEAIANGGRGVSEVLVDKTTIITEYFTTSGAVKHDAEKPDFSLMPAKALEQVAAVWVFGERKYAAFNWAKGFAWRRPVAASLRHIFAWLGGEDNDPESGLPHLAHAVCGILMVIHFSLYKIGADNRLKGGEK